MTSPGCINSGSLHTKESCRQLEKGLPGHDKCLSYRNIDNKVWVTGEQRGALVKSLGDEMKLEALGKDFYIQSLLYRTVEE